MRVYLDVSLHPFYESLIFYPPDGINYVNIKPNQIEREHSTLSVYTSFKRKLFKKFVIKVQKVTSIPRIRFVKKKNFDLYHSGRGVFIIGCNYVMDLEYVTSPYGLDWFTARRKFSRLILRKLFSMNNLKYILPHSYSAMYSIRDFLGNEFFKQIKEKIEVLYPAAVPRVDKSKHLNKSKIILLFVSSSKVNFIYKGGLEVLHAFLELKKKYDLELWIRSDAPSIIKKKYSGIVKFIPRLSRKELFELYKKADIFVYPTYFDTFGYVLIEAMSCALPIVTSNTFAVPEIVRDNINGLIINVDKWKWNEGYLVDGFKEKNRHIYWRVKWDVVERLKEKISELIENTNLYREISKNNLREIMEGRFSIRRRNEKLKVIYERSIF